MFSTTLVGIVALATLVVQTQGCVHVYLNGAHVDLVADDDYGSEDEGNNVVEHLASTGVDVTTFTDFNDVSSWINAGVIVVPKLEVGDLGRNLTSRTVIDIQAFLNGGGKLVVMFPGSVNGRSFLNRLFGWFLASAARCRSSAGYNITDAFLGDSLYNGISFLPMVNSDQGLSISRLPASVQPVYESTYGCGGVMIAPYGSGSVVLYAYDFYFPTENTAWLTTFNVVVGDCSADDDEEEGGKSGKLSAKSTKSGGSSKSKGSSSSK